MDAPSIPLPPDELMIAVSGHANHESFQKSRISGPKQMLKDLIASGIDPEKIRDVLDFGCGCGRFLAGWVMLEKPFRLHGCDYNPLLIQWCRDNLPTVSMQTNLLGKPVPYDANAFDFIYLLSVFTHLTLHEQKNLIAEFHRLLRPKGHVYITFHGEYYYPKMFPLVADGEATFNRDGFLIQHGDRQGTNDCWTLHKVENIVALFDKFTLIKHFRSIDRGPTHVAAHQDTLIFQKR